MSHGGDHILWGEMRGAATIGRYWVSGESTADDGVPIGLRIECNALYPAGPGGEATFREAVLTIRHTAGGVLAFEPVVNDVHEPSVSAVVDGDTYVVEAVSLRTTLPQQAAGAEMRVATVKVPMVRRLLKNGVEWGRWYLRGERFAVRVVSIGALGTGEMVIDGAVLEHRALPRTDQDSSVVEE